MNKKPNKFRLGCGIITGIVLLIMFIGVAYMFTRDNTGIKIDITNEKLTPKVVVNDFCLLPVDSLKTKYGEANINIEGSDSVYNWILNKENDTRVILFTKNGKSEVVRFFNINLGTFFWLDLDWGQGELEVNKSEQYDQIKGINGIDEVTWKHNQNILNVKLNNPTVGNFGKSK